MSKKKSYMDRTNILNEGFFSKLFRIFKPKKSDGSSKEELIKKVSQDPKVKKSLKKLNKSTTDLETILSRAVGQKINLNKFTVKDFFKK